MHTHELLAAPNFGAAFFISFIVTIQTLKNKKMHLF